MDGPDEPDGPQPQVIVDRSTVIANWRTAREAARREQVLSRISLARAGRRDLLARAAQRPGAPASIHGDLALLLLESARRAEADPDRALAEVAAAVAAQRRALALSPAQGSGWARLVYAHDLGERLARSQAIWALGPDDGPPAPAVTEAEALEALEMAFLTRDLSFSLVRFRLQAAGERWASLSPWLRTAARGEVLQLTRYGVRGADALVDLFLAEPGSPLVAIIAEELEAAPNQQTLFERRLARRAAGS